MTCVRNTVLCSCSGIMCIMLNFALSDVGKVTLCVFLWLFKNVTFHFFLSTLKHYCNAVSVTDISCC